ncbi:MAG: ATP-binding protein [Pseudomonadota bacterium]
MKSLRVRLLLLLGALIVITTVILSLTLFRTAMGQANRLFDYHMQQIALALRDSNFNNGDWNLAEGEDNTFDFVIQIWSEDGMRVYQSRKHRVLPEQSVIGYSTIILDNGEWRIYAAHTNNKVIQVAQLVEARRNRAIRLALRSLWPIIPISLVLLGAIWWVVSAALIPLTKIGQELGSRNAPSLKPVFVEGIPSEVAPLVTELNSLLTRLNQAMGSQQQFIADAAHELRSPLTALKLQVQMLGRAKDDSARTDAIARLSGGIERGIRLVEQLLALARQDPLAQSQLHVERTPLAVCARQALSDVAVLASSKQITLSFEESCDTYVIGNAENIRVLIRNLVDNAIRYTPPGGAVGLKVMMENGAAAITVFDSGPGVPDEERLRVFDRFYRIPGTAATGSGLGLPIVKAIADRHAASILLNTSSAGGLEVKVLFSMSPGVDEKRRDLFPANST